MTKKDIKKLWNSVGWTDINQYNDLMFNSLVDDRRTYLEKNVDKLKEMEVKFDPRSIDARIFWKACEEQFGIDAVARNEFKIRNCRKEANKKNYRLFQSINGVGMWGIVRDNILGKFHGIAVRPNTIVEIGSGYGAFKNGTKGLLKEFKYIPFDVIPRFKGVNILNKTPQGFFSDDDIKELKSKVGCVVCFNVFQHLHPEQIAYYISQIKDILCDKGYAIISYVNASNGNIQIPGGSFLYGQKIPIAPLSEFELFLRLNQFYILVKNESFIGNPGFRVVSYLIQKI